MSKHIAHTVIDLFGNLCEISDSVFTADLFEALSVDVIELCWNGYKERGINIENKPTQKAKKLKKMAKMHVKLWKAKERLFYKIQTI